MTTYLSTEALSPVMRSLSGDQRRNRICALLRQRGPMTRAELSRATGIAKSSMSLLIDQLALLDLVNVREATPANRSRSVRGRPGELVELNSSSGAAIGIEFGFRHIRGVIGDVSHEILAEREIAMDSDYESRKGLAAAREIVTDLLHATRITPSRILGIGVSLQTPIDQRRLAKFPNRLRNRWEGIDISKELSEATGFEVLVENDANLAAYAELLWGAQVGNFVYIKLQSGVGGAVVVNHQVVTGRHGAAGEIGHLVLDPNGPICHCGQRGCLDAYASIPAMLSTASLAFGYEMDLRKFSALLQQGDTLCTRIVRDAAVKIGQAAAMVCALLNPDAIILGGTLLTLNPGIIGDITESLQSFTLPTSSDVQVLGAELGRHSAALGGVALVLGQIK
jgi:predicted NBD/HSP70 family sugar kinase